MLRSLTRVGRHCLAEDEWTSKMPFNFLIENKTDCYLRTMNTQIKQHFIQNCIVCIVKRRRYISDIAFPHFKNVPEI